MADASAAARPFYVTTEVGQLRGFVAGEGAGLVVLHGPAEGAAAAAAVAAAGVPGRAAGTFEPPGIGGSARVDAVSAHALATALAGAIRAAGLTGAPILAMDLSARLAPDVAALTAAATVQTEGAARAAGWSGRGFVPPELTPVADGTHLTALWAFLRNAALLDPADGSRLWSDGPALPDPATLDRAVIAAAVRPEGFARLWRTLAGEPAVADGGLLPPPDGGAYRPPATVAPADGLWCDHVDTPAGRVHLRRAGPAGRPVMVLQSAPGSSAPLARVIAGLARHRPVVAPDFPGNGDSDKPDGPVDIARLAAMMWDVADALGHPELDLWGTHTGAVVALEMALARPSAVGRLVMEAPPLLPPAFTADILANYLPPLVPDRWGLHLQQAWNMRRDMFAFWPWYRQDRAAQRSLGLPPTAMLHDWTVGLLKSGRTYDRSYRAAFSYDTAARLPLLSRPALVCAGPADMLADGLETARALAPGVVTVATTPATVWYPNQSEAAIEASLDAYRAFLG